MRAIVLSAMCAVTLGACAVEGPEVVGETTQAAFTNDIFYENFNNLNTAPIGGQNGWTGDCMVVPYSSTDKNLECTGQPWLQNGQNAMHTFYATPNRNYHLQFDVWTRNVVDSTHGKVFLENPPGDGTHSILQILIGCDSIRGVFEYHNNTTQYLIPPHACVNGPRYRVACIWHDGGNAFRCGASVYPADPDESRFVTIPALDQYGNPETIGRFDRIRLLGGIGFRPGTTAFDKVQVLSD